MPNRVVVASPFKFGITSQAEVVLGPAKELLIWACSFASFSKANNSSRSWPTLLPLGPSGLFVWACGLASVFFGLIL